MTYFLQYFLSISSDKLSLVSICSYSILLQEQSLLLFLNSWNCSHVKVTQLLKRGLMHLFAFKNIFVVVAGCYNWATSAYFPFSFERRVSWCQAKYYQQAWSSEPGLWLKIEYSFRLTVYISNTIIFHMLPLLKLMIYTWIAGYWYWFVISVSVASHSRTSWGSALESSTCNHRIHTLIGKPVGCWFFWW